MRAVPRRTECPNEKNEAYAVTKKADRRHGEDNAHGRQFRAGGKREAGIYGASGETLPHGDLRWITTRDFAREVVINPPAKAGSGYEKRAVGDSKLTVLRQ